MISEKFVNIIDSITNKITNSPNPSVLIHVLSKSQYSIYKSTNISRNVINMITIISIWTLAIDKKMYYLMY